MPQNAAANRRKYRLISKTESTVFAAAFAGLILALIASLFLAQHFLVGTARYWDFLRIERYLQLCQMVLEAEGNAWPSEESLQKIRDIGLFPDVYPPDHEIPQPNPRYVPMIESVEIWGPIKDAEGKPTALLRLSRHDINTRHTIRTVRLYTIVGAIGGTLLIGMIGLVLHRTIIRGVSGVSREIQSRLPSSFKVTADDPLEELQQSVGALLSSQAESAGKLRRILDGHSELACVGNAEGELSEVNTAYCRYFGRTHDEVIGTSYLDLINPAYRMEVLNHLRSLGAAKPEAVIEHPVTMPDGSSRWLRWRDKALLSPDGKVREILSFGTDISAEKNLADRIDALRLAFDQMQSLAETGSLTWDFAAERMEWTPETRRLLGIGPSAPASVEELLAVVAPDERETVRRLFREAREQGRNFQHEFRAVLPDGSLRVLQSRAEVLADPKTKLLNHLTCTLRDITALREAEAATKRELRFREAVEQSVGVGIVVSDESGCNLLVNPAFAKMTGWSQEELVGIAAPYPYWPEEETAAINAAFELAISGQTPPAGFELRFCRKNGERFDVLVKVAPLLDSADRRLGWLGAVTDITQLQRARRELQASNERLRIAQDVIEFGIWDWDPVADTLFWDRNSFAIFGYPDATDPDQVWKVIHSEEEQERLTYELRRLIAAGGKSGQDRLRARWPDGTIHEILSTYVIIRDSRGRAVRVLGVNRDVTTELEEERELRNAQERLNAALEGGRFGTFEHIVGVGDVNWSTANYELNGIDPAITDPAELFAAWKANTGEFFPELMAQMDALPISENHHSYEFTCRPPGKEPRRVRVSVFIERNERGHPTRLVGVTRRLD